VFLQKSISIAFVWRRPRNKIAHRAFVGDFFVDAGEVFIVGVRCDEQRMIGQVLKEVFVKLEVNVAVGALETLGRQREKSGERVNVDGRDCLFGL
jgi:hypothetical protein